jgi:hypothetical protein
MGQTASFLLGSQNGVVLSVDSARQNLVVARKNLQNEQLKLKEAIDNFSTPVDGIANSSATLKAKKEKLKEPEQKVRAAQAAYEKASSDFEIAKAANSSKLQSNSIQKDVANPLQKERTVSNTNQPRNQSETISKNQPGFASKNQPGFASKNQPGFAPKNGPGFSMPVSKNGEQVPIQPKQGGRSRKIKLRLKAKMRRKRAKTLVRR